MLAKAAEDALLKDALLPPDSELVEATEQAERFALQSPAEIQMEFAKAFRAIDMPVPSKVQPTIDAPAAALASTATTTAVDPLDVGAQVLVIYCCCCCCCC